MGNLGQKNITNKRKSSLGSYIYRLDAVEERVSEAENVRRNTQAKSQGGKQKENTERRVRGTREVARSPSTCVFGI